MYTYRAIVTRIHDGDTILVDVDLGFGIWSKSMWLRLVGVQAPELDTVQGVASRDWLKSQLSVGQPITLTTVPDAKGKEKETFARYLADIYCGSTHINKALIDAGHAVAWDGKGKRPLGFAA